MATNDACFHGDIPSAYDRYMVPMLFDPYAADLAQRVASIHPHRVLEVAAGSGALTRAMSSALPHAEIIATDLNQAMLDVAALRHSGGHVVWRQADASSLPFPAQTFDAIASQFGVMFFPDKGRAYREILRVLKPKGTFFFNTWDSVENNAFAKAVKASTDALFRDDPLSFFQRTPHSYFDAEAILLELEQAGFQSVTFARVEKTARAPSARDAATGFCKGSPLRAEIDARQSKVDVVARVADTLEQVFGKGPIEGGMSAFVFTAEAPRQT
ncbi:SAM-dependent methyltransferase [Rhizobium sp. R72]|uniref:class I SAM-dependent methyltransferase n=1 Tax=unclassified Rhizobium TaxID=2613769 RepID=UPI000B529CFE|nr:MULTISPECIES: class I SAM-dependent methyltransferase [unclassified Rhizobium]OWV95583.1 SAM-dependent methyltransferase [Rhizobium sp. R72]OWV95883.1 SAM-dependent methyltransferase [Rhizobium sp. R711]